MKFSIPKETMDSIVDYLAQQPWNKVENLMDKIRKDLAVLSEDSPKLEAVKDAASAE